MSSRLPIKTPDKHTTLEDWVNSLSACFDDVLIPNAPKNESKWRDWASTFMQNSRLLIPSPLKSQFPKDEDWRKWAILMIRNIQ